MKLDTTHAGYEEWCERWQKIRAAVSGQHEVRKLKEKVLPKLNGHDDREYQAYLKGAVYTNYTGRTLEALLGMVFRKEPVAQYPAAFQSIYGDLDLQGNSATLVSEAVYWWSPLSLCEQALRHSQEGANDGEFVPHLHPPVRRYK